MSTMTFMIYLRKSVSVFFEYDTPRIVHIRSKRIGIISRLLQFIILAYIIGFALVWKKGYQEVCPVDSTVTTKVKGVLYTSNLTNEELNVPHGHENLYKRIWDPVDYIDPAAGGEHGGFFIMTNVVITPNQTRDKCPEDPKISLANCKEDSDCPVGHGPQVGNGVFTGHCIPSTNKSLKTCEIFAWCPVERDVLPLNGSRALLEGAENFTVLIKNSIEFPKFGNQYFRRNILETANATYLQNCLYHPTSDPFCPVFRIGDIVQGAGEIFSEVAIKGAVFEIQIIWKCDLDWDFLKYCKPKYSFVRMDNPSALIAPGWNFRTAEYNEENRRTQIKKYGIKFLIQVEGEAGKFNFFPLFINVGSGLALMGLTTILCDWIVLRCMKNKKLYKDKKYLNVKGDDAFDIMPEEEDEETN